MRICLPETRPKTPAHLSPTIFAATRTAAFGRPSGLLSRWAPPNSLRSGTTSPEVGSPRGPRGFLVTSLVLGLALTFGSAAQAEEKKEPKEQVELRNAINKTAQRIDACTGRYLVENPGVSGKAKISVTIVEGGKVGEAQVQTQLLQARSLRACLERVAQSWQLPPPKSKEPDRVELQVTVEKGVTFKLHAPGEKPKGQKKKADGFLRFTPSFVGPSGN